VLFVNVFSLVKEQFSLVQEIVFMI